MNLQFKGVTMRATPMFVQLAVIFLFPQTPFNFPWEAYGNLKAVAVALPCRTDVLSGLLLGAVLLFHVNMSRTSNLAQVHHRTTVLVYKMSTCRPNIVFMLFWIFIGVNKKREIEVIAVRIFNYLLSVLFLTNVNIISLCSPYSFPAPSNVILRTQMYVWSSPYI